MKVTLVHLVSNFTLSYLVSREQQEGTQKKKRRWTPGDVEPETPRSSQEQARFSSEWNRSGISRAPQSEVPALSFAAILSRHDAAHDRLVSAPS